MKTKNFVVIVLGIGLGATAVSARAQSLADVARAERARKGPQSASAKVYTNDNLPKTETMGKPAGPAPEATPADSTKSSEAKPPAEAGAESSGASTAAEVEKKPEDKAKTKEYWQGKFEAARAALARADEESRLSDDELNLAQANEARELDPDKQKEFSRDVSAKQAAADSKHTALDKAKQALDDLQKEFDESGAPKEWIPAEEKQ